MYLTGLLIGLGFHALSYLFTKAMDNKKRVFLIVIMGVLSLATSITVIGGFEGMPFGVLSLGIISTAILLAFFGKSSLWKKAVYTFLLLFVFLYSAVMFVTQVDYWVVKKDSNSDYSDLGSYIHQVQIDPTIRGYKTFTLSEGNKGIVLSLGEEMSGNNIEILDVEEQQGYTTVIKIRTFYNQSNEKNPYITIGLNRAQDEIIVIDTDGTLYEQVK